MSKDRVGKTANSSLGIFRAGETDPFRGLCKHPALKAELDFDFRGVHVYRLAWANAEKGNYG